MEETSWTLQYFVARRCIVSTTMSKETSLYDIMPVSHGFGTRSRSARSKVARKHAGERVRVADFVRFAGRLQFSVLSSILDQ
jgi:hypothetical protein